MVDYLNPIDPFEPVKIEKIESIGSEEEEEERKKLEQKPVTKKLFLYLTILKFITNSLKLFKNHAPKELTQTPIQKEIQTIKASLEALKEKDLSRDTEFMNFFAFIWMKFLKDYSDYNLKNLEISSLIKKIISEINSYPQNTDFTLGYYISEFAGYKWIPFPYMEILKNLHDQHLQNHETSTLTKWTNIIEELLSKI